MLKIGDRVKFLSDTGVGVITKIKDNIVWVDVEDGFEVPTQISDVVAVSKESELDALERIGEGDDRPGSKKAKHQSKKNRVKKIETDAFRQYGKISLVDDDDLDDDEELLDLYEIKERYVKNLLAVQKREQEIDQEEQNRKKEKAKTSFMGKPEMPIVDYFAPKEEKPKVSQEAIEQLAQKVKEDAKPKTLSQFMKKKKTNDEVEVVDLHAEQILPSLVGLSSAQIITSQLDRFTISLESYLNTAKHGKVVYIHGVGKGRLRYEIEKILKSKYPKLSYQDASFKEYGFGAILIYF